MRVAVTLLHVIALGCGLVSGLEAAQTPLNRLAEVNGAKTAPKSWDSMPNPDDTGNFIFDNVGNLLKHWSNARYPNGHIIVPALVTTGTMLFHGRMNDQPPPTSEWLSFDSDYAMAFASIPGGEGSLFTYTTTRELHLLHFDGSSASKRPSGTMDSQDILMHGYVTKDWNSDPLRITELCAWGKQYGLDGFLRMNFDFEIMFCNFSSGAVELVSHTAILPFAPCTLSKPRPSIPSPPPPGWQGSLRNRCSMAFEGMQAGSWHNFLPVTGVRVDYSRMLTFYHPKYRSLFRSRMTVASRTKHRLLNMSREDAKSFQDELRDVLERPAAQRGSGVDWGELIRHIIERHVQRLDFLSYLLRPMCADLNLHALIKEKVNTSDIVRDMRFQVLTMLSPYLTRASVPSSADNTSSANPPWLSPAMEHCSTVYTSHLPISRFTLQEHVLKTSIEQTVAQICRTLGVIWTTAFDAESISSDDERTSVLVKWKAEINSLQDWLGWSQWVKCEPECAEDKLCAMTEGVFGGNWNSEDDEIPECVSRLDWKTCQNVPGGDGPQKIGRLESWLAHLAA